MKVGIGIVAYRNTDIDPELCRILKKPKPVFYVIASVYMAFSGELIFFLV